MRFVTSNKPMPFLPPVAWLSRIREEAAAGGGNYVAGIARLARLDRLAWSSSHLDWLGPHLLTCPCSRSCSALHHNHDDSAIVLRLYAKRITSHAKHMLTAVRFSVLVGPGS